jgi:hypothetical protein
MSSFTEIRPVDVALMQADGQTDMTKVIGALHEYSSAPEQCLEVLE